MATATTASILADIARAMKEIGPIPPQQDWRFGSLRYVPAKLREKAPRDPRMSVPLSFGGIPIVLDRNLPPYMAVMREKGRRLFDDKFVIFDLRKKAHSDDMAQMLDDLRRAGGVPK